MQKFCCLIAAAFVASAPLLAQTHPSAEGGRGVNLWVGASVSTFNPDYGCTSSSPFTCWGSQLLGISPYAETRPLLFHRVAAEGQARFLVWRGPGHLTETSYMGGPRVNLFRYRNLFLGAKFMIGTAHLSLDPPLVIGAGTYFAYAPGGAIDYRLTKRISVRGDYEYQFWPSFAALNSHHGLTPNGMSLGVSYAVW